MLIEKSCLTNMQYRYPENMNTSSVLSLEENHESTLLFSHIGKTLYHTRQVHELAAIQQRTVLLADGIHQ